MRLGKKTLFAGGLTLALLLMMALSAQAASRAAEAPGSETPPEESAGSVDTREEEPLEFRQEILVTAGAPELLTVRSFTGSEIEAGSARDVVESLRHQPGLEAVRRGPVNLDPVVRGLAETQLGLFVDGTRTFAAGVGRMDSELSHVSPRAVEMLEVVKGPYALSWGAGSLSAIQLRTFRPSFGRRSARLEGRAGLSYGANASSGDGFASVWSSGEKWASSLLVNVRRGGDYQAGGGEEVPGDFRSGDARLSLVFRPSDSLQAEYLGGYQQQKEIDYPGRLLDATYFYTRSHSMGFTWTAPAGGVSEASGRLYVNRKDHLMNNDEKPTARPAPDRVPPFGLDVDLPTESNTAGASLRIGGEAGSGSSWALGSDYYRLQQTASRTISRRDTAAVLFRDIVWPDAEIENLGAWGRWMIDRPSWSLAGTVRTDRMDATAGAVSEFFAANTTGALEDSETSLSAAVSSRWRLDDSLVLSLGLGRAVRGPSALERYSDRIPSTRFQVAAEFMGNPALEPESSLQLDAGVELSAAVWRLRVETFYRVIEDYVTVAPDPGLPRRLPLSPPTVFRYVNGDEGKFWGGEVELAREPGGWLSWRGGLSYVRGEDTLFDEPAFGMPPLSGRLAARAVRGRYAVDAVATAVAGQTRVATRRFEQTTAGYTVFDLVAGVEASTSLDLRIGIENLTDKRYADHLNSLNPFTRERVEELGRNLFVGLEYRF